MKSLKSEFIQIAIMSLCLGIVAVLFAMFTEWPVKERPIRSVGEFLHVANRLEAERYIDKVIQSTDPGRLKLLRQMSTHRDGWVRMRLFRGLCDDPRFNEGTFALLKEMYKSDMNEHMIGSLKSEMRYLRRHCVSDKFGLPSSLRSSLETFLRDNVLLEEVRIKGTKRNEDDNSVTVEWNPVFGATDYEIEWYADEDLAQRVGSKRVHATSCTLSPISPKQSYWIRTWAVRGSEVGRDNTIRYMGAQGTTGRLDP